MKTLNGRPVRIIEFDGKFEIQCQYGHNGSKIFGFQIEKPRSEWVAISPNGEIYLPYNTVGLTEQKIKYQANTLDEAIKKIESLNKGVIIHEL